VKWPWSIDWGVLNDDILLRNDSRFALTNVVLEYELKQDARTWKGELKIEHVAPGQTQVWTNVISVPGGRLTASSAALRCDQDLAREAWQAKSISGGAGPIGDVTPSVVSSSLGSSKGPWRVRVDRPTYAMDDLGMKVAFLPSCRRE